MNGTMIDFVSIVKKELKSMNNKNIRIMQMVGILMVNNAFILLAVADIDLLKFALIGGWALIVIAGIYLARATEEMVDDFNARYREQEQQRRYR